MSDCRVGVVGLPGQWSTEALADALEDETGFRLVVDLGGVRLDLDARKLSYNGQDLCDLDALVVKKVGAEYSPNTMDRIELLRFAAASGVRVFSAPEQLSRLVNRLSCTVALSNAGIPMPETVVTEDTDTAVDVVQAFGSAVFKPLYSTKARGMCVMESSQDVDSLRMAVQDFQLRNPMMYIQKRLALPGRDLGMVFVAGKYLCTYARLAGEDQWNTTIHAGGRYARFDPPQSLIELATAAQAPFGMDFTTVDVAESASGPVVFEVSAFGGFRGALEGAGVNAAAAYAEHVLASLTA